MDPALFADLKARRTSLDSLPSDEQAAFFDALEAENLARPRVTRELARYRTDRGDVRPFQGIRS